MNWVIEEDIPRLSEENMGIDAKNLFSLTPSSNPLLRFYRWKKPAATYGYFFDPSIYFDLEAVLRVGLDLGRRPTGGGALFHTDDLAFSIVVPASHPFYDLNPLHSYQRINLQVVHAIQHLKRGNASLMHGKQKPPKATFCMAQPTIYDIIIEGKKVGGAAERKTKGGLLHQGTLFLRSPDPSFVKAVLSDGEEWFTAMEAASHPLASSPEEAKDLKEELKQSLINSFTED